MQLYADMLFTGGRVYTADPDGPRWAERGRGARRPHPGGRQAGRSGRAAGAGDRGRRPERQAAAAWLHGEPSSLHRAGTARVAGRRDLRTFGRSGDRCRRGRGPEHACAGRARMPGCAGAAGTKTSGQTRKPHRRLLDEVAPDLPVALDSKELHAVWANSAALRRAGITRDTPDVPGGVIERDADGEPTGVLRENAWDAADPSHSRAAALTRRRLPSARPFPSLWRTGIVAFHNANDTVRRPRVPHVPGTEAPGRAGRTRAAADPRLQPRARGCDRACAAAWAMRSCESAGSRCSRTARWAAGRPACCSRTRVETEQLGRDCDGPGGNAGGCAAGRPAGLQPDHPRDRRPGEPRRAEHSGRGACARDGNGEPGASPRAIASSTCSASTTRTCLGWRELDVIASVQPIHATSDMLIVDKYWGPRRAAGRLRVPPIARLGRAPRLRLRWPDRATRSADRHSRGGNPPPGGWHAGARRLAGPGAYHGGGSGGCVHLLAGVRRGRGELPGQYCAGKGGRSGRAGRGHLPLDPMQILDVPGRHDRD